MFTSSFDRRHGIALQKFAGLLTHDDLDMIDLVLVDMAGSPHGALGSAIRCL